MNSLQLNPLEVLTNAHQDFFAAFCPKALNNPFCRVFVAFFEIAVLASWKNVGRDIARIEAGQDITRRNGNKVILAQDRWIVPQPGWVPAVRASAMPVLKSARPISIGERGSKVFDASNTLLSSLQRFFGICFLILPKPFSFFIAVIVRKTALVLSSFLWVFLLPAYSTFPVSNKVMRVCLAPLSRFGSVAHFALRLKFLPAFALTEFCDEAKDLAFRTLLNGDRLIDHLRLFLAGFASWWGQAAKLAVRFDDQSKLVTHKEYFTA